jgi:hypothetical protein
MFNSMPCFHPPACLQFTSSHTPLWASNNSIIFSMRPDLTHNLCKPGEYLSEQFAVIMHLACMAWHALCQCMLYT